MVPSITTFSELLVVPQCPFKSLREVVAVKEDSVPKIVRTSLYAEAEIHIDGKRHLLCMPLSGTIPTATERLCAALGTLETTALCDYRILRSEIELRDSEGSIAPCDLILHTLPEGEPLDVAVMHISTKRLLSALELLATEVSKVGFLHRNLKPSNLIFGDDGHLYPIRYHYASLGAPKEAVMTEMERIRTFIESNPTVEDIESVIAAQPYESRLPYDQVMPLHDMMRCVRKGELYGYLDDTDCEVIAPQFIYAENFFENRAVVQTRDGKMGAIDHRGEWVIDPRYDMLGYEGGEFEGRIGNEWQRVDYLGNQIK